MRGVRLRELDGCTSTTCMHSWFSELERKGTSYPAMLRIARQGQVGRAISVQGIGPLLGFQMTHGNSTAQESWLEQRHVPPWQRSSLAIDFCAIVRSPFEQTAHQTFLYHNSSTAII